jgi:ADP-ribosyl-[dinitrogen reductase] hydrolase
MRLAPVAIFARHNPQEAAMLAGQQSMTTHANALAADACQLLATMLVEAMRGLDREEVLRSRHWFGRPEIRQIAAGNWVGKRRDEIASNGYVVSTLEAAIWCVHRTSSFEEALILAVNLGHDSDTVGAITGQLAGALYGLSAIPEKWLGQLAWRDHIEETARQLLRSSRKHR